MQVELVLPGTEEDILFHPIQHGLVAACLRVPGANKGKFGCRHCGQKSTAKYTLYHGLVAHLAGHNDRHGIVDIRDEDIFQTEKGLGAERVNPGADAVGGQNTPL